MAVQTKINGVDGVPVQSFPIASGDLYIDPITGNVLSANQVAVSSEIRRSGGNEGFDALECVAYNYHIGQPQVVKTNNRLVDSDNNELNLSNYPDHKNLTGTQCYLIAPLYECCWVRPNFGTGQLTSNGATLKGWVLIARSKSVLSYEECYDNNGNVGRRPVLIQYFSYDDILGGPYTPIAGPSQPDRAVSLILQRIGPNGTVQNFTYPGNGQFWGNCYGDFSLDFFGNWLSSNNVISNVTDLQSYRTMGTSPNGSYPLTNTVTGASIGSQLGIVIEGDECKYVGSCKLTKTEEPPTKDPVCVEEITVNNLVQWSQYSRNDSFQIEPSLLQLVTIVPGDNTQPTLLNDGNKVNLSGFGFGCEIGQIQRFQQVSYRAYPKFVFCRLSNGTIRRTILPGQYIIDYNNPEFSGGFEDRIVQSSREFDPSCCDGVANAFLTSNAEELRRFSERGVTVSVIESSKRFELLDSCGCEEVEVTDLGCFYRNLTRRGHYSVILKGDIKDPRTHTGVRRPVVDERCQSGDGPEVYKPFDRRRDIILNRTKSGTKGLFDGDDIMECYYTSSTKPITSNQYYYEVTDCETCGKIPYFAVAYGHISGSGSIFVSNEESNKTPTDSIYSQYQLICLEPDRTIDSGISVPRFEFVSASATIESDDVYVINFNRNGIKDKLDPGNFEINLASLNGSSFGNNFFTGSNVQIGNTNILQLIDDSDDFDEFETCDGDPLTSYNIISGSLTNGKYEDATINTYGKVYPNLGIVVLHPKRLNEILEFNTVTGSNINGDNAYKLFTSISGAAAPYSSRTDSYYLTARNVKYKTTSHYFVRAYAPLFNYSNNPSFVSGSTNTIFDKCFIKEPQTYITSIGLYNNNKELVAIAKLSQPVKKTFETDLLIKIRLNW